jgi:abortive infection bacteriophage resistance protein
VTYAKPYLSVADQLALIEGRGMIVSDRAKAIEMLHRIGYYRLSGYWYPFRASLPSPIGPMVGDNFKSGTELGSIIDLYVFDKKLRLLMLDAFERVEIALRVQIALTLGRRGAKAHRDPGALHGNFARRTDPSTKRVLHQIWLQKTDDDFAKSREEFAKHFRKKYPGEHPPIWIACEAWDFGAMSRLFGGLQQSDQTAIAAEYGLTAELLASWIRTLNVARNVCAHHSRFWNKPSTNQPKWPTAILVPDLAHIAGNTLAQTRAYGTAALSRFLLRQTSPATSWSERLKTLCEAFPSSTVVTLQAAGFPHDWRSQSIWQ